MICFRSFGVWKLVSWTSAGTVVGEGKIISVVRPAIRKCGIRFWYLDLFLVAFGCCFLDLLLARIRLFHSCALSLGRSFRIKRPGLTIGAEVNDRTDIRDHSISVIIAFDVLPSLAPVAEHCVSIILVEATDTLDSVVFLIFDARHSGLRRLSNLDRGRQRSVGVDHRRRKRVER